ncbi:MAG: ABC transporter ATP-binding protein [Kineosporiaceae bacterium]
MGTAAGATSTPVAERFLEVRNLTVEFPSEDGIVHAVNDLSFSVDRGRTLAIVGESGSGKSVTSQAIMGLHLGTRARLSGEIWFDGQDLIGLDDAPMREMRGSKMAMIFQDPLSSLHPFYKVGMQISEAYLAHHKASKAETRERSIAMLRRVGVPNPERCYDQYPHQFSGGMRQRAMIAMALVCNPQLLIADEPTTALDVTVQAQILELLKDLQSEYNSAIIIITHDLGVVAEIADDVVVMYGGRCVEQGSVGQIFAAPQMPYTWGLLGSMPRLDRDRQDRLDPIPGSPPSLVNLPSGCVFHDRCGYRQYVQPASACVDERPELLEAELGHSLRCHINPKVRRRVFEEEIRPLL